MTDVKASVIYYTTKTLKNQLCTFKIGGNLFFAKGGGIIPLINALTIAKIVDFWGISRIKTVNYYKFYFHFFGENAFYENTCLLPDFNIASRLCKTC